MPSCRQLTMPFAATVQRTSPSPGYVPDYHAFDPTWRSRNHYCFNPRLRIRKYHGVGMVVHKQRSCVVSPVYLV